MSFLKTRYHIWVELLEWYFLPDLWAELMTFHCNHFFLSFSFCFFQSTVGRGLDEERCAVSVLFIFCLKMLFLVFKWNNIHYIFKTSCCEWCFGCVRLDAFRFVPFLIVVFSIVFVVWKAWQICYSVLKQFCHNWNACGPAVFVSCEKGWSELPLTLPGISLLIPSEFTLQN